MATRSTIKITGPDRVITLYRHWDGYPAETGRHIARVLRGQVGGSAAEIAERLLTSTDSSGRLQYEMTSHEEHHSDSEWRYRVWLFDGDTPGFQALNRRPGGNWRAVIGGGPAAYRQFIASETRDLLSRIRRLRDRASA